jgi:hypothetical protein
MNALEKNVVSAALATMQRRNLPIGRLAQMKRICAVHGTAWTAQYREVNGLWRLERCVRPAYGGSDSGSQASNIVIDVAAMEAGDPEICPWCGCGPKDIDGSLTSHVLCSGCGNNVCLGRTVGKAFRCCDQCGKKGQIGGYFTSYTASEVRNVARGAMVKSDRTAALPAPARLQLTSGKRK